MKPIENTRDRYGAVAVLFHWVVAVLVIGLAALGLYMVRLPDAGFDKEKIRLIRFRQFIELHKWLGYLLIGVIFIHMNAALRHHFMLRDDTLRKMLA
jgi:cytochrome b561